MLKNCTLINAHYNVICPCWKKYIILLLWYIINIYHFYFFGVIAQEGTCRIHNYYNVQRYFQWLTHKRVVCGYNHYLTDMSDYDIVSYNILTLFFILNDVYVCTSIRSKNLPNTLAYRYVRQTIWSNLPKSLPTLKFDMS